MATSLSLSLSIHLPHRHHSTPSKLGFPLTTPSKLGFPITTPSKLGFPITSFPLPRLQIQSHKFPQSPNPSSLLTSFLHKPLILLITSLLLTNHFNSKPSLALPPNPPKTHSEDDVDMYERVLERDPQNIEALKVVVYGRMRKGRTGEAVKYVERLIAAEPDEVEWRLLHALSFELMGELGKAKRLFREILKERPLLLRALHVGF